MRTRQRTRSAAKSARDATTSVGISSANAVPHVNVYDADEQRELSPETMRAKQHKAARLLENKTNGAQRGVAQRQAGKRKHMNLRLQPETRADMGQDLPSTKKPSRFASKQGQQASHAFAFTEEDVEDSTTLPSPRLPHTPASDAEQQRLASPGSPHLSVSLMSSPQYLRARSGTAFAKKSLRRKRASALSRGSHFAMAPNTSSSVSTPKQAPRGPPFSSPDGVQHSTPTQPSGQHPIRDAIFGLASVSSASPASSSIVSANNLSATSSIPGSTVSAAFDDADFADDLFHDHDDSSDKHIGAFGTIGVAEHGSTRSWSKKKSARSSTLTSFVDTSPYEYKTLSQIARRTARRGFRGSGVGNFADDDDDDYDDGDVDTTGDSSLWQSSRLRSRQSRRASSRAFESSKAVDESPASSAMSTPSKPARTRKGVSPRKGKGKGKASAQTTRLTTSDNSAKKRGRTKKGKRETKKEKEQAELEEKAREKLEQHYNMVAEIEDFELEEA